MPAPAHLQPDHDETLIARLAADDLTGPEVATATRLVADCPACAELYADLRSIMAATAALPAPVRSRDFRLTEADAARLRRTGWQRVLGRFGDPRLAFTRPLATGLVTLGIAGLLLSAAPSFLPLIGSSSAATAAPAVAPGVGGAETTGSNPAGDLGAGAPALGSNPGSKSGGGVNAAASTVPFPMSSTGLPEASAPAPVLGVFGPGQPTPRAAASSAIDQGSGAVSFGGPPPVAPVAERAGTTTGPPPLVLASLVLIVLGAALFALRWVARRTA